MTLTNVLTIAAIILGPILAVLVARWNDDRRAARDRQWEIFRNLMRNRKLQLSYEYVVALNMVEVEFQKRPSVIAPWKALMLHLNSPDWEADERAAQRMLEDIGPLLVRLLDAMAKVLKIDLEQIDILKGGYYPSAWDTAQAHRDRITESMAFLYSRAAMEVQQADAARAAAPPHREQE